MAHRGSYSNIYKLESNRKEDAYKNGNKKVGLARLAKTRSLSGSINKLNLEDFSDIEDNTEVTSPPFNIPLVVVSHPIPSKTKSAPPSVVGSPPKWSAMSLFSSLFTPGDKKKRKSTLSLPENSNLLSVTGRRSSESSLVRDTSPETPSTNHGKESAPVPILPNRINVANLGYQQNSKYTETDSPKSLRLNQVPRSDPELFSGTKPILQGSGSSPKYSHNMEPNSTNIKASRAPATPKIIQTSESHSSGLGSLNNSPLMPRKSKLRVPSIKKSNSYTHLADALHQIHYVCLNPSSNEGFKIRPELCTETVIKATQAPSNLLVGRARRGRATSWYPTDGESDKDYPSDQGSTGNSSAEELGSRSNESLLDDGRFLSSSIDDSLLSRPNFTIGDAKHKNYLCGGLGNLLGESELLRYYPDRTLTVFIATWNMNGKEPPMNLDEFLLPKNLNHMPDLYVIGTQESGGDRSEWEIRLQTTIGPTHVLFTSTVLGILHLIVFLRRDLIWFCSVAEEAYHSLRPGTYFKTKGAVAVGFQFFGTRILFINSHLFAHEEKQTQRIQNYKNIISSIDLPRVLPTKSKYKSSPASDVTQRYDVVFWMGDLNFRVMGNRDDVIELLNRNDTHETYEYLLRSDQLNDAKKHNLAFTGFDEGSIHFAPTFKFDPGTNDYDSSSKQRVPSYTDRILFKSNSNEPINCVAYDSCPMFKTSDHKPVCGVYQFKIRQGNDNIPLAAGLFNREVYLEGLKRRRTMFSQSRSNNCKVQ